MGACLSSKKAANKVAPITESKPSTSSLQPAAQIQGVNEAEKGKEHTPATSPQTVVVESQPQQNHHEPEKKDKEETTEPTNPVANSEKEELACLEEKVIESEIEKEIPAEKPKDGEEAKEAAKEEPTDFAVKKEEALTSARENAPAVDQNSTETKGIDGSFSSMKGPGTPVLAKIEKIYSSSELGPDSGDRLGKNPKLPPILPKEKSKTESTQKEENLSFSQELPSERSKKVRADIQHINEEAIKHEFDGIEGRVNAHHGIHNKLVNRVAAEELIEDKILTRGDVVASLAVVEQDVIKAHVSKSISREDINLYASIRSRSPGTSRQGTLELSATYTKDQLIEQSLLDGGSLHSARKAGIASSQSAQDLSIDKSPSMNSLYHSSDLEFPRRRTSRFAPEPAPQAPHTPPSAAGSRRSSYVPLVTSPLISSGRPDLGLNSQMAEITQEAEDAA